MCLPSMLSRTVVIPMTSQYGCLELLITQTFLSGPVKFEVTRVDCTLIFNCLQECVDPSASVTILISHISGEVLLLVTAFFVKLSLFFLCNNSCVSFFFFHRIAQEIRGT